jgi:predicted  nucleic acid-binding Zn-ribbon protein
MACMDHECSNPKCNWWAGNNEPSVLGGCPKCGAHVISTFDEEPDRDYDGYKQADYPTAEEEDDDEYDGVCPI